MLSYTVFGWFPAPPSLTHTIHIRSGDGKETYGPPKESSEPEHGAFWRVHVSPPFEVLRSDPVFSSDRRPRTAALARASPCFAVAKLGFQTIADVFCHDLPRSLLCRSREKTQPLGVQRSTSAQASFEPAVETHATGPGVRSTTWKVLPPSSVAEMAPVVFLQVIPLPTRPCRASQKAIEFGTREDGVLCARFVLWDVETRVDFALCLLPWHPLSAASSESPSSSETRTRGNALATLGTIERRQADCLLEIPIPPIESSDRAWRRIVTASAGLENGLIS